MIDFIPYKEALALKELGFDEKCDYYFTPNGEVRQACGLFNYPKKIYPDYIKRPTFSQSFRFFREKYKLKGDVKHAESNGSYTYTIWKWNFDNSIGKWERIGVINSWSTYEEAELECLKKLISVVS